MSKKHQLPSILLSVLIIYSIWFLSPLTKPGFPRLGDGEYFLARLANYHLAFSQGQLPPRWAPNLNFGFGYPILNFHYPLPNIIGTLFIILGFSVVNSFKLVYILAFVAALSGMWQLTRKLFGALPAFISVFVYLSAPYFIIDFYNRGSIGELLVFGILPWCLYFSLNFLATPKNFHQQVLIPLFTLLLLAHNLTSLIGVIFIIFYLSFAFSWKKLQTLTPTFFVSGLLVSFFWLPAIFELPFTSVSSSPQNQIKLDQLIPVLDQIKLVGSGSLQPPGPDIGLSLQLGSAIAFIALISILCLPFQGCKPSNRQYLFLMVFIFASVLIISPIGKPLWAFVSWLGFLQFPWRLYLFTSFSGALLAGWLISQTKFVILFVPILILSLISLASFTPPSDYLPYEDPFLYSYPLTSTSANEFDPPWYHPDQAVAITENHSQSSIISSNPDAKISIIHSNGTSYDYQIDTPTNSLITEKTLYFPGWETTVDDQPLNLDQFRANQAGLINYLVSAGQHHVTTQFTQNTPARLIGNTLTLMGVILYGYLTQIWWRKHKLS